MDTDPAEHPGPRPLTRLDPTVTPGGDPACWLAGVCPCGAFNESAPGTPCWNCGRIDPDA